MVKNEIQVGRIDKVVFCLNKVSVTQTNIKVRGNIVNRNLCEGFDKVWLQNKVLRQKHTKLSGDWRI